MTSRLRFIAAVSGLALLLPAGAYAQAAHKKPADRGWVHLSGTYQGATTDVESTVNFTANLETGTFTSKMPVKPGKAIDAGAGVRLWNRLGVEVAATGFTGSGAADVTANVPHPFFFRTPRAISGTADLYRKETAVHVRATFSSRPGRRLQFIGFAGPVFFSVEQDLIDKVNYSEAYPFDTATYTTPTTRRTSTSKTGFGVGADVAYYFKGNLGVGFSAAYAKAEFSLKAADDSQVTIKAGGTTAGLGLRIRF